MILSASIPLTILLYGGVWQPVILPPPPPPPPPAEVCEVSWYGERFRDLPTASGEPFDPDGMTAAHKTLPLGTWVEVSTDSGRTVRLQVNDRGPFIQGRCLDLSRAAFDHLGDLDEGVMTVEVRPMA